MPQSGDDGRLIAGLLAGAWQAAPTAPVPALTASAADRLLPVLTSTNAGPMLYHRLGPDSVPAGVTGADHGTVLRDSWRMQQLNTEIQCHVIAEVSTLLRDAGVRHALLKGWAAARFYHDPALRPFGDIDLLIHPDDDRAALDVLWPLSFTPDRAMAPGTGGDRVFSLDWHYPAHLSKLDLHNDLTRFHLTDTDALMARVETVSIAGQPVPVLGRADMFQVFCLHTLRNGCWRPIWLTDIAAFVDVHRPGEGDADGRIDWQAVADGRPLISHWMAICIGLARDLLGLDTAHLPTTLGQTPVPAWLSQRVLANWQVHFSDFHDRVDIGHTWRRNASALPAELLKRWPDPVRAVFERGRRFSAANPVTDQALFFLHQLWRGLRG